MVDRFIQEIAAALLGTGLAARLIDLIARRIRIARFGASPKPLNQIKRTSFHFTTSVRQAKKRRSRKRRT